MKDPSAEVRKKFTCDGKNMHFMSKKICLQSKAESVSDLVNVNHIDDGSSFNTSEKPEISGEKCREKELEEFLNEIKAHFNSLSIIINASRY